MATFAAAAGRLAGIAGVTLGWRPHEFWQATPDELAALTQALSPEVPAPLDGGALARLQEAFPDG